jgi:sec-independent protein translocase protein TatA
MVAARQRTRKDRLVMLANILGSDALIVLVVAVVVLFGGSQLPKLARNVGAAGHELRKAQRESEADHSGAGAAPSAQDVSAAPNILPVTSGDNARQGRS